MDRLEAIIEALEMGYDLGRRESCLTDSFAAEGGTGGKATPQPPRVSPATAKLIEMATRCVKWWDEGSAIPSGAYGHTELKAILDALAKESSVCEQRR